MHHNIFQTTTHYIYTLIIILTLILSELDLKMLKLYGKFESFCIDKEETKRI